MVTTLETCELLCSDIGVSIINTEAGREGADYFMNGAIPRRQKGEKEIYEPIPSQVSGQIFS